MLEIQKLRKDINWLLEQIKCLMKKSDLDCPIEATEWSPNHSVATGNPYILDSFVWLNGHIYKSLIDNNIYPPTNASYWDDLGEGHLLLEEQSNWNAITGRAFIRNKPTNTSDFVNDGEDGSSPYATLNDLSASIPLAQDLDSVLTEGDTAQNKQANIESIGLYDSFAIPFGFARIFASKSRIIFQSKLGTIMGHISQGALGLIQGSYLFTINLSTLTNNRIATFQNKSGVVAYLSDISASAGINATAWSANHTAATGNPYLIGTRVFYLGNVYQAIATNDSIIPTNATYWDDLGPGFLLEQEPTPALQEVVNKGGGISNYGGVGNASIQSTNFVSNRTVYFNNNSLYPLAIVDNLNAAHNISFDIDSLIRNNVSYSWASILAPQVNADWNATSGFAQILNKPTIPAAQVNSDWNATSGVAEILNKPTIPSIAGLELQANKQNSLAVDGTGLKYPTVDAVNSAIGNLNTNISRVTVKLTEAITKGQAVYVSGANGTNILASKASNATEATSSKTIGLLETTGATNAIVDVITDGLLSGLNTLSATIGDPVWLGTSGNLIYGLTNKPYAPTHLVYIGVVTRVNASNGEILVKVQNGFELREIHDVDLISNSPTNNQLLSYDSVTSLWKNKSVTTADIAASTNKNYVTDAQATVIGNTSGTNTGDETNATIKTKLGAATTSVDGYLTSTNWNTFNKKIAGIHTLRKPAIGTATSNALTSTAMSTIANVNDRILVSPYIPAISFTAANMYVNVTTLIASAACKVVIYSDLDGVPDQKLYASTDLALTSNGVKPTSTGFTFAAGTTYWIGVHTSLTASISAIPVANALCIGTSGIINYTGFSATATYASGAPTTFGTSVALSSLLVPFVGITL